MQGGENLSGLPRGLNTVARVDAQVTPCRLIHFRMTLYRVDFKEQS